MMIKRFFFKRFIIFFVVMLIPTLLLGTLYLAYINRSIRTKIEGNTRKALTSVYDNVELVLGNIAYQQMLTSNPRMTLSLTKMMNQDFSSYEDSVMMTWASSILSSAVNNNLFVKNIYFYIEKSKRFLSTSDGLVSIESFFDKGWYETYHKSDKSMDFWLERRSVRESEYRSESEIISFYQRMKNAVGVIVVNINPDRFNSILNHIQTEERQSLFILDLSGNVLFSNETGSGLRTAVFDQMLKEAQDTQEDNAQEYENMKPVVVEGKTYRLSSLSSEKYKIRLVSLIPESDLYQQPNEFLTLFLMIALLSTAIVSLLSFYITSKNFKQINHLITVFELGERGDYQEKSPSLFKDEYDIILNNIISLFINTSQLRLEVAEKQLEQKAAEFSALQMQINPHFLFNTLQTLDMEALRRMGPDSEMNRIIRNLSDILKYSLEDPSKPVSLRDEIKYLKLYTDIQIYRYEEKFILLYEYEEELLDVPVFRLMLQPLIENSLYHGIKPLESKGYIKLKIRRKKNYLHFSVIDNGVGMTKDEKEELKRKISDEQSRNIGLTNVNRRLILNYGQESALAIRSRKHLGTVVAFKIPDTGRNFFPADK